MKNNDFTLKLKKVYHFIRLYGFARTYVKLAGRLRGPAVVKMPLSFRRPQKTVAIIGCGQFSFSTIGFFLKKNHGNIVKGCFDIDQNQASSFASYYSCQIYQSMDEAIGDSAIKTVYIASNHASHSRYAIEAIKKGKTVYVEKPLSTSFSQFAEVKETIRRYPEAKIYIGYNRPHSPAIKTLRSFFKGDEGPVTLNCFICGHLIPSDHWYRAPEEGTRVCGNLGHWLDLTVHLIAARGMVRNFQISIAYSNQEEPDDNICVNLTTDANDLVTIILSSRNEPFEGINETINFQMGSLTCRIDDFRRMILWKGGKSFRFRYFRKNVGHETAIMQPFAKDDRIWAEVEISTLLMLTIAEMVKNRITNESFEIRNQD